MQELGILHRTAGVYDAVGLKPWGCPSANVAVLETKIHSYREWITVGTWNVWSMNQGKLDVLEMEMACLQVDVSSNKSRTLPLV